jgi:hypothetical protein
VFLSITVNYSLSSNAVQRLFREVGTNWFEVLIPPRVANYSKSETAKYSTVDIIPNREVIRRAIRDKLAAEAVEPWPMNPDQFGSFVREDIARWTRVARDRKIDLDA